MTTLQFRNANSLIQQFNGFLITIDMQEDKNFFELTADKLRETMTHIKGENQRPHLSSR